jgi:multidrug resistance efflux pump
VQIRRLEPDGSAVAQGQTVVELDNSTFAADLEDKRLKAAETASRLAQRRAEVEAEGSEAAFEVERRRAELAKARIRAAVPEDLLARRELEDRRLARKQAELDLAQAEDDLAAKRVSGGAELEKLRLDLEAERRAIATAQQAIAALSLKAPVAGTLVVADHPWEGRKLRQGDTVWVGMAVARLPDLAKTTVTAYLPDVDDGRVAVGALATCTLDAFPARPFTGRVTRVSPIAREEAGDSLRRFFELTIVPEGGGFDPQRMRPGMSVRVEVVGERRSGVLLVPRRALDLAGRPPRARLAEGGLAPLELGPCNAQDCVLLAGLSLGTGLSGGGAQ